MDRNRITMCGLLILIFSTSIMTQGVIVIMPGAFSFNFCHIIDYMGGSCTGSTISQPTTCNLDECENDTQNSELRLKYTEFVSNQQQQLEKHRDKYSHFPFRNTIKLVNAFFVTVPKAVFTMTNLTDIEIIKSKLRKINFNDFLTLQKLKKINLSNNTIIAIQTNEESSSNSTVEDIDLSFNFIEAVPNNFVRRFNQLKNLNMSHNMISSVDIQAFEGTVNLETLDLSHNRLQEVGNIFSQLPRFFDSNGSESRNLAKLSKLILDDNFIEKINFTDFFETGIPQLSIGGNQIPCDELALVKYYSKLGEKFNRIVTAKNFSSPGNGNSINGISCQKAKDGGGITIASDYPSSNTIMLISSLKIELENTKKQLEFVSKGTMFLLESINIQLREIKKNLPAKRDLE